MLKTLAFLFLVFCTACTTNSPQPIFSGGNIVSSSPEWSSLQLTGKLVLIQPEVDGTDINQLDLSSGKISRIYHAPGHALVSAALVSPDGSQILLSYAPPWTKPDQIVYPSLYQLPVDGTGDLQPILKVLDPNEAFFNPSWARDGKSIFASHYISAAGSSDHIEAYSVVQVSLDGEVGTLLKNAEWPSLSADGSKIAYLSVIQGSTNNELYLADSTGANPAPLLKPGSYPAVDDHFFSPDGKAIIFSAVNQASQPTSSFFDRIFGVQPVLAHSIPSDWYEVPVSGGNAQRLTNLNDTGMYACSSPDGQHIAFISKSGLYVMNPDGSGITRLSDLAATGTVDWVP
jgi:Tol biopolymer transport system component